MATEFRPGDNFDYSGHAFLRNMPFFKMNEPEKKCSSYARNYLITDFSMLPLD